MNYNSVTLAGRLVRDIEMRATGGGTAVGKFTLAINRSWLKDGEKKEEVAYVDVKVWGKQAETLAEHVHKGDPLFVTGRLETETWQDKETGANRSKLGVVLDRFEFLPRGERQDAGEDTAPAKPKNQWKGKPVAPPAGPGQDDW